jgi:hypothetical protein
MQVPSGGGGAVAAAPGAGGAAAAPAAEEKKEEKEEEKVCTLITRCNMEANIDVGGIGRRHGLWSVRLESGNYVVVTIVVYCLLTSF